MNKTTLPSIFLCLAISGTAAAQKAGNWELSPGKDEMTGEDQSMVYVLGDKMVKGWLRNGPIMLGMYCQEDAFILGAPKVGFRTDETDCNSNGCSNIQNGRIKLDDNAVEDIRYAVLKSNNNLMTILRPADKLVEQFKAANQVKFEVAPFKASDSKQVITFSLSGFTKANAWCESR